MPPPSRALFHQHRVCVCVYECVCVWLFLPAPHTIFSTFVYECKSAVIQEKATLNEATHSADVPIVDCMAFAYISYVRTLATLLVHTNKPTANATIKKA